MLFRSGQIVTDGKGNAQPITISVQFEDKTLFQVFERVLEANETLLLSSLTSDDFIDFAPATIKGILFSAPFVGNLTTNPFLFIPKLTEFTLITQAPSAVPVPAAVWLFGSGLIGLIGIAHRKRARI